MTMDNRTIVRPVVLVLALSLVSGIAFGSGLNREPGAIYLADVIKQPIMLKVLRPTTVYLGLDAQRNVGTLIPDREVQLLAMSDRAFRVKGLAQHDQVSGWVRPSDLGGMTDEFKENLKKLYERQVLVEELISKNQVALGMTLDEVMRAMGEPTKKETKVDGEGRKDKYEYITYKNVAVSTGRTTVLPGGGFYNGFTYVKVEDGKVTIEFEDEMVTSIAESEGGAAAAPGAVRIVPRPIILFGGRGGFIGR
jgi:hypothetical protein